MSVHSRLLKAIRARSNGKKTPFNYGILLASDYVRTIQDRIGDDACYRFASRGSTSFNDVLEKAAKTLVYGNEEMLVEKRGSDGGSVSLPKGVELPKNTLMVFRHTLTTSTKDRDGDVLHSEGAVIDPKMLLIWQHVHTLPLGKMLVVSDQNERHVKLYSCIVDMNELCHDAAVMVDNDMGRFSHGFRALDFTEQKDDKAGRSGGFDIKQFEVMEESLVSVPANPEAGTDEVLLSLVEGGKLKSPIMKAVGKAARDRRPTQVQGVTIKYREKLGDYGRELSCSSLDQLKEAVEAGLVGTKEKNDENVTGAGSPEAADGGGEDEGAADASKEAGEGAGTGEEIVPTDEEMKSMVPVDGKPYPKEHAARLRDPKDFEADSMRRVNNKFGEGIHGIFGRLSGQTSMVLQAIRFDKDKFTAEEAQKWLKDNKQKPVLFEPAKEEEKTVDGEKDFGQLTGSYELTSSKLRALVEAKLIPNQGRGPMSKYAYILGTFPDHVVACVRDGSDEAYYKLRWEMKDGEPVLVGEPEKVQVQTAVFAKRMESIKQGRVLSKANEVKIQDAMDDIAEAGKMDVPRPCKALCSKAHRSLSEVLSTLGEEPTQKPMNQKMTVTDASAVVLAEATTEERKRLIANLQTIESLASKGRVAKGMRRMRIYNPVRS